MNQSDICIEVCQLSKTYATRVLFSGISFSVNAGECTSITGPNGSGKSTLLKLVAGVLRPTGGTVWIKRGGRGLDREERLPYFGMVSPEIQMYEALTGYENIMLLAGSRGQKITQEEAARLCERMRLGSKGGEQVKTYSTGMRQRLKFALLLGLDVPVWLLDEPSSNLDREGKTTVLETISQGLAQGKQIVLATNDEAEAAYAHKTIVLL